MNVKNEQIDSTRVPKFIDTFIIFLDDLIDYLIHINFYYLTRMWLLIAVTKFFRQKHTLDLQYIGYTIYFKIE